MLCDDKGFGSREVGREGTRQRVTDRLVIYPFSKNSRPIFLLIPGCVSYFCFMGDFCVTEALFNWTLLKYVIYIHRTAPNTVVSESWSNTMMTIFWIPCNVSTMH